LEGWWERLATYPPENKTSAQGTVNQASDNGRIFYGERAARQRQKRTDTDKQQDWVIKEEEEEEKKEKDNDDDDDALVNMLR
jgi:hypothetical protein